MTAQQLTETVFALPPEAQRQIDDFIAFIHQKYALPETPPVSRVRGVPGRELLRFVGTIELDDLELMQKAIEEGCEQVDADEW